MTNQIIEKKKRRTKEDRIVLAIAEPAVVPKVKKPRVQKPKVSIDSIPEVEKPQVLKSPDVNIYSDFSIAEASAPKTFWQKIKDFFS